MMPDPERTIRAYPNGPLLVRGAFELLDADGRAYGRTRATVALCRCGRSRTKPFCDGTHKAAGFQTGTGESASTSELSPASQEDSSRPPNLASR